MKLRGLLDWRLVLLALGGGLALYLALQVPSNEGPWQAVHAVTPSLEFKGRVVTVRGVRDFRYGRDRYPTDLRYEDRRYSLDDLRRAWFGLSHFGPMGLAHAFLSFEFDEGERIRYLALSIEGRLRVGQRYGVMSGLLRQFTKISIYASEQDVIGLRSHLRGERVFLYPVVDEDSTDLEAFFRALADDANSLVSQPEFYNTFVDNCLTNLLKHVATWDEITKRDLDVLLPGRTDRLTYAFDATPSDIPFEQARKRAEVHPSGDIDDPDFSARLRCGWHGYREFNYPACERRDN